MPKHSSLPFKIVEHSWEETGIYSGENRIAVCEINPDCTEETQDEHEGIMAANATFIVRACNNHYKLRDALEGLLNLLSNDCEYPEIETARQVLADIKE